MFFHNFKYSLKTLFRNKTLIFWTFAFPIIIGLLFNMAFADLENNEKLDVFEIAIVDNENYKNNQMMVETFNYLSSEDNSEQLFNIKYTDLETAKSLLADDEIVGYLLVEDTPLVTIKTNGINQTVFKTVVEEIKQNNIIMNDLTNKLIKDGYTNPQDIYTKVSQLLTEKNVNIKDNSSTNISYTMIEFYTLTAMTCLYGGILGSVSINQNLANMTSKGKRMAVTPIPKLKMVLSSVCASFLTQLLGVFLLLIFTIFILNVDYGDNIFYIILLVIAGSLAGLSIGVAIATLLKSNDSTKTGIIIAITMFSCFLAGMMGIGMKYLVDTNAPIVGKLNPATMITDGFYSLYYYSTLSRYWFDFISLIIFSSLLISISFISLRRQKYDSI